MVPPHRCCTEPVGFSLGARTQPWLTIQPPTADNDRGHLFRNKLPARCRVRKVCSLPKCCPGKSTNVVNYFARHTTTTSYFFSASHLIRKHLLGYGSYHPNPACCSLSLQSLCSQPSQPEVIIQQHNRCHTATQTHLYTLQNQQQKLVTTRSLRKSERSQDEIFLSRWKQSKKK